MLKRIYDKIKYMIIRQYRLVIYKSQGLQYIAPNFIFQPRLDENSVIIDAGCSYEADFSIAMINQYGLLAFGVDPTRKHAASLEHIVGKYPGRFVYIPCALADTNTVVTFYESRSNESGSLISDHVNVLSDEIESYSVEALTLSSLLNRIAQNTVDILKLDLEGSEYALVDSLSAEDLAPFRQVFIEFHHHAIDKYNISNTLKMVSKMSNHGYSVYTLDDHNYLFIRTEHDN